jgi:hypothetical protein
MSLSKRMFEAQVEETPLARLGRARQCVQNALRAAADGRPDIVDAVRHRTGAKRRTA